MGCTHSRAGTDIAVTTESSSEGATPANYEHEIKIGRNATMGTVEKQSDQHQSDLLPNNKQFKCHDSNGSGVSQTSPPPSLHSNGGTNTTTTKNDSHKDDFTKDYVIIKQVMVGMSALSNIYMVMKRPKPTSSSNDDDDDDEAVNTTKNVVAETDTNVATYPPKLQLQENDSKPQPTDQTMEAAAAATLPSTTTTADHIPLNENIDNDDNNNNNTTDNEIYVLQVIDMESVAPERRKSMRKEIIALQSIIHPNSKFSCVCSL
jgi:hypothetical protein